MKDLVGQPHVERSVSMGWRSAMFMRASINKEIHSSFGHG
jgi:hypothetical protein